jgi:signal transduction histidine kinase
MKKLMDKIKLDVNHLYPLIFTLVFSLILLQYSFNSLEAIFFDLWNKFSVTTSSLKEDYVIVYMDEETDQFLGEVYPYTYATHNKILNYISAQKPKAMIYHVDFKEPSYDGEISHYLQFNETLQLMANQFPVRLATSMDLLGELVPPDKLQKIGFSLGLIHEDSEEFSRDSVSRKAIINVSGDDSLELWVANLIRKFHEEIPLDPKSISGAFYDNIADATFAYFKYPFNPMVLQTRIAKVPINRVVSQNLRNTFFTNKIVLIGHQYQSRPDDYVLTPFNKDIKAPKIDVHIATFEAIASENIISQVPRWITNTLSILFVLILSLVISQVNPSRGLIVIVSSALGTLLFAFLLFVIFNEWIFVSHMILSIFLVYYIWVPFRAIAEYQTRYAIQEESKLLKKVDHLKQNFISLMSHDLKTPVAKISGITESILMKLPPDAGYLKEYVFQLKDSTHELNNFINSILDLTKIESENIKLNIQSKDVNQLIENVHYSLLPMVESKGMHLELNLGPLYPIAIDVLLIKRVISNLVENAIKYAGEGAKLKITTYDDDQWVTIEVADNGIGIAAENLEHIFDRFYRIKNDAHHLVKGSGLGLYLVKYFIELHEGTIRAESQVGQGTKFIIQLRNIS